MGHPSRSRSPGTRAAALLGPAWLLALAMPGAPASWAQSPSEAEETCDAEAMDYGLCSNVPGSGVVAKPQAGRPPVPAPTAPPRPDQLPNCELPATQAERDACAAGTLGRAKAELERVYSACTEKVAPALRQELVDSETSWKNLLPVECQGAPHARDTCLASAYRQRVKSLAEMHPECAAAPGPG